MIYIDKSSNIIYSYITEGFRRLYSYSVNEYGKVGMYDYLYMIADKNSKGQLLIPFNDYFCPTHLQDIIIADLLLEKFCVIPDIKRNTLAKEEKERIKNGIYLGPSPFSSLSGFINDHPHFTIFLKNNSYYLDSIKTYLSACDLEYLNSNIFGKGII